MIYTSPQTDESPAKIKVAIGKDTAGEQFSFEDFTNFIINDDPMCKTPTPGDLISSPNSNSFLDLDGDCMPDMFL